MVGLTPTAVVADGLVAPRSERRSAQVLGRFAVARTRARVLGDTVGRGAGGVSRRTRSARHR